MNHKEEKTFMETMDQLTKWLELPKAYILNPERAKLLEETCDKLQTVLDEEFHDCTLEVNPCPLGLGDVSISLSTYSLTMRNIKKFYEAIQHLSNFEVYPIGDEMVRFSGILSKVTMVAPLQKTSAKEV